MLESGNDEFTLLDVSKQARTSTGTIYQRFESKENLVRAVIFSMLEETGEALASTIRSVDDMSSTLPSFLDNLVEGYAHFLESNAPLLRLCMDRAEVDSDVSQLGKENFRSSEAAATRAIISLGHATGIAISQDMASTCYHIVYASLTRQFSIGASKEAGDADVLDLLKRELSAVCLAYLMAGPRTEKS